MKENHPQADKSELQLHLEGLFEQMIPPDDAPPDVKEEVFNTISTLDLAVDVVDLFTGKFVSSEAKFLDLLENPETIDPPSTPEE